MGAPAYEQLLRENQQLRERIAALEKRLEELERSAKRQAAPFSKGPPKLAPKKPGRKKGKQHGKHGHRPPPPPDKVEETLDAPLPSTCPDANCGGNIVEDSTDKQFQTEIPRQPIQREFTIHCGHCAKCGKKVRGRHPLQTSNATGAAASQLGPDAQATIVDLNKRAGMSCGKIADTFARAFGIDLTRSACIQAILRAGKILMPAYEMIKERLIRSHHLTPDETGWRIGGHPAWLHGWVGDQGVTLYAIDPQRSADVLEKIIGIDWSGSMTHDGFSSYDRFENALHQQCVDHALRRARGLLDKQAGAACIFPRQVIELFTDSLQERDRLHTVNADIDLRGQVYEGYTEHLLQLTERCRANEANDRFARHLFNHAASWFLFLLDPDVPATNHRAEQALKTPIVNRKVWGGNRTLEGCQAQAVLCSVLQTLKNLAIDAFSYLSNAFRGRVDPIFA
jgi:transposase